MESNKSKLTNWTTRIMHVCETHHSPHDTLAKVPVEEVKNATCGMPGCERQAIEAVEVKVPLPEELAGT